MNTAVQFLDVCETVSYVVRMTCRYPWALGRFQPLTPRHPHNYRQPSIRCANNQRSNVMNHTCHTLTYFIFNILRSPRLLEYLRPSVLVYITTAGRVRHADAHPHTLTCSRQPLSRVSHYPVYLAQPCFVETIRAHQWNTLREAPTSSGHTQPCSTNRLWHCFSNSPVW